MYVYVVHVCVCGACIMTYVLGGACMCMWCMNPQICFGSGCDTCIYYCGCIHTSFQWYICVHVVHVCVDDVYIDNIYKY